MKKKYGPLVQLLLVAAVFAANLAIPFADETEDCKDCEDFTLSSANQGSVTVEVCATQSSGGYPTCVSGYNYGTTWQEAKDGEGAPCVHSPEMYACPPIE